MSAKSLYDFPDLCLLAVFKRIPLIELFRNVRLVNTRWSQLVQTELNQRGSLVIVDDRYFKLSDLQLDKYQSALIEHVRRDNGLTAWSRLPPIDSRNLVNRNIRYLDADVFYHPLHNQVPPEMITTLVNSLPRIRSLTVVQRFFDLSALDQIVRMIDHWRGELVSLKLYMYHELTLFYISGGIPPVDHKAQLNARTLALFDSINRATSLKHLKLKLDHFYHMDTPFRPPLTILSQLSTFDVRGCLLKELLGDALVRYASGNRDLQIATDESSLQLLLGINHEFCVKFVDIKLEGFQQQIVNDLDRFCVCFSSLVHLSVANGDMPVTRLAQRLSSLTQLVHLSMHAHDRALYEITNLVEYQELPPDQIVPIPSVRLLSLHLYVLSHNSTEQFHLHQVFPNVQVLNLETFSVQCSDCDFDVNEMYGQSREDADRLQQCAQLTRRPFRRFPRLHTIQINAADSIFLPVPEDKRLISRDEL